MARWRLMNPHYLKVPGTEWEYVEISRATGKQARVRYPVGLFLNPRDSADHNYPGEIIVAHAKPVQTTSGSGPKVTITGGGKNHDIIFEGPPTPDMEPLDEEAEKISAEWASKWVHPIESLSTEMGYGDYSQSLITKFEGELTEAIRRVGGVPSSRSIKAEEFDELKKQVAELTKQNQTLLAKLIEKPQVKNA